MTSIQIQEEKEKLLAFVKSKNRPDKIKSEQGETNDSPLSRRIQVLIRIRYYVSNTMFLIKKSANPLNFALLSKN